MKILGLVGGTSWVSTAEYYKLINEGVNKHLGDLNFSKCIIYSFNYQEIKNNNDANNWAKTLSMIADASKHLIKSGAEAIVLCANTMHLIADDLQKEITVPIIHIADETAKAITAKGIRKIALLGTKFTMEKDFFTKRLKNYNIETIIPEADERDFIHYTIFEELGRGLITAETKKKYLEIINDLIKKGAEGVILGCTEIPLLIQQEDVEVPVFDTTLIHSQAAVAFSLG
ncbi:aspartate/glutamate racemase family protein [Chitinophagaceae bacterium LWZ2-11]